MWELDHKEGWTPKKWCYWTSVLEMVLDSPLDGKEIKPVILKEIKPEHSLEGLRLKLKLQYFGHLMWRMTHWKRHWCWERLKTGEGDDRGWDGWMASPTQWTRVWASSGRWWRTVKPGVLQSMGLQRVGHDWATEQQQIVAMQYYMLLIQVNNIAVHNFKGYTSFIVIIKHWLYSPCCPIHSFFSLIVDAFILLQPIF